MSKYKVTFNSHYKWAKIQESWIVEAKSEEEALELVNSGDGEYIKEDTKVLATDKLVSDEHTSTEII
jgi:hypothetical protein